MLQRLHQPTAATVAAEYDNISKFTKFMTALIASAAKETPTITMPQQQFASMMQRWCSIAKPLLMLLMDKDAIMRHPSAVTGAGMLASLLGNTLVFWTALAADEKAEMAVKQQIAQHTAGACFGDVGACVRVCADFWV